jgi:hypothetical protein
MCTVIRRVLWLSFVIACSLVGCNFFVDTDALSNGNCAAGFKACNSQGVATCVATDLPGFGCAQPGCIPCDLANATALCSASGQCTISLCKKGYTDCDGNSQNGCETETDYDPSNCGTCHTTCAIDTLKHVSTAACSAGSCVVGTCMSGYGNCDEITSNGCETNLATDNANCGACHTPCSSGKTCNSGMCI